MIDACCEFRLFSICLPPSSPIMRRHFGVFMAIFGCPLFLDFLRLGESAYPQNRFDRPMPGAMCRSSNLGLTRL